MEPGFRLARIAACLGMIAVLASCRSGDEVELPSPYGGGAWLEFAQNPDATQRGRIEAENGPIDYELTIRTLPMAPPDSDFRFIADMNLKIGDEEVLILRRASELLRVHRVSPIFKTGKDHRFIIWGGSGEEAYTAHFVIQNRRLVRREFYKNLQRIPHVMEF